MKLTSAVQSQGWCIFWIDQTIFIQHDLTCASQYGAYELPGASQNKSNIFNFSTLTSLLKLKGILNYATQNDVYEID